MGEVSELVLVPTCDLVKQEPGTQNAHFLCLIVIWDVFTSQIPTSKCVCVRVTCGNCTLVQNIITGQWMVKICNCKSVKSCTERKVSAI